MAGLPQDPDSSSLTCDVLRLELRGFAQNELRRELKACLGELRPQLQEDMQACVKEAVATAAAPRFGNPRLRTSLRSQHDANDSPGTKIKPLWARPPRGSPNPEPTVLPDEDAPRMSPTTLRDSAGHDGPTRVSNLPAVEELPESQSQGTVQFKEGKLGAGETQGSMALSVSQKSFYEADPVDRASAKVKKARTPRSTVSSKGLTFRTYASDSRSRSSGITSVIKLMTYKDLGQAVEDGDKPPDRALLICRALERLIDWPVAIFIALNGLFLGIQAQYQSANLTEAVPSVFPIFECIFCLVFTTELIIRIASRRMEFLYQPGMWRWNIFDSALVAMQLVEVVGILITDHESQSSPTVTNVSFLRLLRVLRLFRVLRLVRLLQFISELNMIISSIANSLRSLFWTMVLLMLMVYIMGIIFTQMAFSWRIENPLPDDEQAEALDYWWGSLLRSTLSLYEAILGGVDWDSLVSPLADKISIAVIPMFALYIAFSLLAMMNVITGIFVESALKNAAKDKDREFIDMTRDFFADDVDEGGILKKCDFEARLDQMEMRAYLKTVGIEPKDARLMFQLLDGDRGGSLELEALMLGMLRLRTEARALDIALMLNEYESQASTWMECVVELEQQVDKVMSEINIVRTEVSGNSNSNPSLNCPKVS